MPEVDADALAEMIRTRLAEQPGVAGLEPTLATSLQRDGNDGIEVTVRGGLVDLDLSVRARADLPARLTAGRVYDVSRACIEGAGLEPGTIDVIVLGVDPELPG